MLEMSFQKEINGQNQGSNVN